MCFASVARVACLRYSLAESGAATRDVLLIAGLGLLLLGAGLGLRDPWPPDEPRFALMAREMAHSGDWLFPMRAGELYPDKPPLFMWLIAVCYLLTDSLRVAFLLPSLLAGLAMLVLVYDLGRRLWHRQVGLAAALLLLATIQFTWHARSGQIDALLAFWTTLAMYGLLRHLLQGPDWRWYGISFAAAGFGIITKGVGFLPVLVLIPYAFGCWRGWPSLSCGSGGWRWAVGPALMLLAVTVWLVPMLLAVHQLDEPAYTAYRNEILFGQTVDRYVGPRGHIQPVWYFFVEVIPLFWLPLSTMLPWLVPRWLTDLRNRDSRVLLLLGWVALVIVFFTASPAKRAVYLLPSLPAAVLAAAPHLPVLLSRRGVKRVALSLSVVAGLLPASAIVYFLIVHPAAGERVQTTYGIEPWGPMAAMALAFACIVAITRLRLAVTGFGCVIAAFWLLGGWWLFPVLDPAWSGSKFMRQVEASLDAGDELGIVRFKEKFLIHADRPVTQFGYRRPDVGQEFADAAAWLAQSSRRRLLVGEDGWQSCFTAARAEFVGYTSRREWYLVDGGDLRADCVEGGDAARAIRYDASFGG